MSMDIKKMSKTLRQKLTDWERNAFGDVLATEVSPKGMLGLGMAAYFGVVVGCASAPTEQFVWANYRRPDAVYSQDQAECRYEAKQTTARSFTGVLDPLRIFTPSEDDLIASCVEAKGWGWRNYTEQKKAEEERARIELEQSEVPKLIAYNRWDDFNNDNEIDMEMTELIGISKKEFDLNKEELHVAIASINYEGKIIFKTWNSKNKLIGETLIYAPKNKLVGRVTGPNDPTEGDFMDNLKGAGPGDYLISATLGNGKELYLPLTIK